VVATEGGVRVRAVVVIPTYNEVENIQGHVEALLALPGQLDVLVVDDSSPDGTADLVAAMSAQYGDRVQCLSGRAKAGLGKAYDAGFARVLAAGYDAVVQMDADGSHDPASVPALLAALEHADVALGSRYCPGGGVQNWAAHRRLLSRFGNVYAKVVLRSTVKDLTGGFKAWRAPVLRALASEDTPSGYAYQIDRTHRAQVLGATVTEVPITFRDRQLGTSKMTSGIAVEALSRVWAVRREVGPAPRRRKSTSITSPTFVGSAVGVSTVTGGLAGGGRETVTAATALRG
jgi:dolichol-phosphate mannosyltransferase